MGRRGHRPDDPKVGAIVRLLMAELANRRWECGYSRRYAAGKLGVSATSLKRWEEGTQAIPLTDLVMYARMLGLDFKGQRLFE